MKNNLVSAALESLESPYPDPAVVSQGEAVATAAQGQTNTEQTEMEKLSKDKLIMSGPLSTLFTRALNIRFAKKDAASNQYEGVEPAGVAVESQQLDMYYALATRPANSHVDGVRSEDPTEPEFKEIPETLPTAGAGTMISAPATREEIIKFVNSNDFAEAELDTNFVFFREVKPRTDGVFERGWDQTGMLLLNEGAGKDNYVVESIEIVVKTRKIDLPD